MKLIQLAIMIAAVLSGIRVSNATNDGTYFYIGVVIALVVAVWMYWSKRSARAANRQS